MATKEFKRVGPPCVSCGRPLPVSGIKSGEGELEKLKARLAKLSQKVTTAEGIKLIPVVAKKAEGEAAAAE